MSTAVGLRRQIRRAGEKPRLLTSQGDRHPPIIKLPVLVRSFNRMKRRTLFPTDVPINFWFLLRHVLVHPEAGRLVTEHAMFKRM